MATNNSTGYKRRAVQQLAVPCNLNELSFSSTYAETRTTKRRRPKRKPLKIIQEDETGNGRIGSPVVRSVERERSESPLFPAEEPENLDDPARQPEETGRMQSPMLPPVEDEGEVNTTAWERSDEIMAETSVAASPEPEGAVVLSPESSERQYYREPTTGFQREIWRPGDGDGSQSTDYYQRTGPVLPVEQRWRMFQSNIGPIGLGQNKTEPPRFVFLDDRAAHEVLTSDIQRARLNREWPHDFAASGKIRARRTHCGRPAIKDPLTSDYHSTPLTKTSNYYFTGEKDYNPVIYRIPPPPPAELTVEELNRKRKAEEAANPLLYNPRGHGHNQYTPKDMMVKFGAETFSRKKAKGEEFEMLAKLKAMAPNVHVKDKLIPRVGFGDGTPSNAGSVMSKSKTEPSEVVSVHSKATVAPEIDTAVPDMETEIPISATPQQDQESDDDSDTDLLPKAPARQPEKLTPAAAAALNLPRQMGYIERRVLEQALAQETMNAVTNQDDVVRIAGQLAEANVTLGDQTKEIERLRMDLDESQSVIRDLQGVIEEQERAMEGVQESVEDVA